MRIPILSCSCICSIVVLFIISKRYTWTWVQITWITALSVIIIFVSNMNDISYCQTFHIYFVNAVDTLFIRPKAIYSLPCNLKSENHLNQEKNYRKKYILASSQNTSYHTKNITRFNDNNDQKSIEWCHEIV